MCRARSRPCRRSSPRQRSTTAQITALTQTYGSLQAEKDTIPLGEPYASIQVAARCREHRRD